MATLRERLTIILPGVLPVSPDAAINGTELLRLVRPQLGPKYSEASIRQHFSVMAADPTAPIAKVDQGHGYYLRPTKDQPVPPAGAYELPADEMTEEVIDTAARGRAAQLEEKFRSIIMRYAALNNQFPMHIEHTRGTRRDAGVNKWKFPDLAVLEWQVGEASDKGYQLDRELLEVKKSLGEQPFKLHSLELKAELTSSTFRQHFFQ